VRLRTKARHRQPSNGWQEVLCARTQAPKDERLRFAHAARLSRMPARATGAEFPAITLPVRLVKE